VIYEGICERKGKNERGTGILRDWETEPGSYRVLKVEMTDGTVLGTQGENALKTDRTRRTLEG